MAWLPPFWLPGPIPSSGTGAVPNPAETAWRLGTGAAIWDGRAVAGFDLALATTVMNSGVPLAYADADTLDASIWRGQDGAPVVTPGVSWISAPDGTLALTASFSGLDPGVYRFQVGVTASGLRSVVFDGDIEVVEAPGSATTGEPYVTRRDLLYWYDQIETLQTIKGGDATFLEQRVESSDEFDRDLVVCYNQNRHPIRTRRAFKDPVLQTFDVIDPTANPPGPLAFAAAVAGGGVVVDRNVRELVAKLAIAKVLDRQEVMGGRNTYREEAAAFRQDAMDLWRRFDIQVDTSSPLDGITDLLVGEYITLIPTGTAP